MGQVFTVKMPDIGEGVVEGEVIEWLKKISDPVKQDEPVVIVMTDKATVELPSPYPGVLFKQYVQPGQMAVKDKPLYDIEVAATSEKVESKQVHPESSAPVAAVSPSVRPTAFKNESSSRALATPPVRKLAHDLSVDIDQIEGTGEGHHVVPSDIKNYIAGHSSSSEPSPLKVSAEDEAKPFIGIHYQMAQKMKESHSEIPHFSYFEKADAHFFVQLRENLKDKAKAEGINLTFMPFIIKALSLTCAQFPVMNSSLDLPNKTLIQHNRHDIGIAMATRWGLIVPVLRNLEKMSLTEIIKSYEMLKQKAFGNKLSPSDMQGSTVTLSNFGVSGGNGLWATPIINYPEVAILAVSRIHKEPLVKNDQMVIREVLNLSWSFDHRLIDGQQAVTISQYFTDLIQNPSSLL